MHLSTSCYRTACLALVWLAGCTDPEAQTPVPTGTADALAADVQAGDLVDDDAETATSADSQDSAGTDAAGPDAVAVDAADAASTGTDAGESDSEADTGPDTATAPDAGCIDAASCAAGLGKAPNACVQAACIAGACSWQPIAAGGTCDTDGLSCTIEICDAKGVCQSSGLAADKCGIVVDGKPACFDKGDLDPNACAVCDPAKATTEWSALAAGTVCGAVTKGCVQSLCSALGKCEPVPSPSLCPKPASACKAAKCDMNFGCTAAPLPEGATCDADFFACTLDACDALGACGTVSLDHTGCGDGVACTLDLCDPGKGCTHAPQLALCDDANVCTQDGCSYPKGCSHDNVDIACSDGLPCTAADTCAAGACVPGKTTVWSKPLAGPGEIAGVLVGDDGGLLVARNMVTAVGEQARVDKLAADGTLVWSKAYPSTGEVHLQGILSAGDGETQLFGRRDKAEGSGHDGWALLIDINGAVVKEVAPKLAGSYVYRAGARYSGTTAFAGAQTSMADATLQVLTDAGKSLWISKLGDGDGVGVLALTNNLNLVGYMVAVVTNTSKTSLVRTDVYGKLLWSKTVPGIYSGDRLVAVPSGYALAGAGKGSSLCVVRTDFQGEILWLNLYGDNQEHGNLALLPDGGFVVTSFESKFNADIGHVRRTDGRGNLIWDRIVDGQPLTGGAWGKDALGFAVAKSDFKYPNPGTTVGVLRTDVFGESDCAKSGKCAAEVLPGCDDGKACTVDTCDGSKATPCSFKPVADAGLCEDGLPCTLQDTCQGGSCVAGSPVYFDVTLGDGLDPRAIAVLDGGDVVLAGALEYSTKAWMARTDALGKEKWQATYGTKHSRFHDMVALTDDTIVAVGYTDATDILSYSVAWVLAVDGNGVQKWVVNPGTKAYNAKGVARLTDGSVAVVGGSWATRIDAQGKVLWHKILTSGEEAADTQDVVGAPDGGAVVLEVRTLPGTYMLDARRVDSLGNLVWAKEIGKTDYISKNAVAVAVGGEGFAFAAWGGSSSLAYNYRLFRVDIAGAILWQADYTALPGTEFGMRGLAVLPDGFALLGSGGNSQNVDATWLIRLDPMGKQLWQQDYGASTEAKARAVAAAGNTGFFMTGFTSKKWSAWLARTDATGNASCTASGKCFAMPFKGCDDLNPCTVDACVPAKGCVYTLVPGC